MKKVIVIIIVLGCLGMIGREVYRRMKAPEVSDGRRGSRVTAVEVTGVQKRTLHDVAEFTGTLLPASRFEIAPKVPGRLDKLLVNIGQEVHSGDLIAELDRAEFLQGVAQATAELEVGKANLAESQSALNVIEREYKRAKKLFDEGVSSEAELDQASALYEAAKARKDVASAQILQRDAALKAAEVRQSYTRIQADWNENGGQPRLVAEKYVDEGTMLRANDPIVSIVDLSSVIAVINVIERDFPRIGIGQEAAITTDAYPGKTFTGRVIRKAPVLKEESRQARVEIEVPNAEGLLASGMFVRASIQFAEHRDVTAVPTGAVVQREGKRGVFAVDTKEMKARFVPIEGGIQDGQWLEVIRPPLEGSVVTIGQHLLEDGAAILIPDAKPAGSGKPSGPGDSSMKKGVGEGARP
jgi:RND family efflux transporter MFP subunit